MTLLEFIFGESEYKQARNRVKEYFLAGKISKKEYLEALEYIKREEEAESFI